MQNRHLCIYCDQPVPEGYDMCGNCRRWEINRLDPTQGSPQSWDGGTMLAGDVANELNCSTHDAERIIDRFGFRAKTYKGISQRELRFLQMEGEIAEFLKKQKPWKKREKASGGKENANAAGN